MKTRKSDSGMEWLPRTVVIVGVLILLAPICVGLVEYAQNIGHIPEEFCTREDPVYKAIVANTDKWVSVFYNDPSQSALSFSLENGKSYIVNASEWYPRGPSTQFYVAIIEERNEPFGLAGYAYNRTDILDHRYTVRSLDENIYCYQMG